MARSKMFTFISSLEVLSLIVLSFLAQTEGALASTGQEAQVGADAPLSALHSEPKLQDLIGAPALSQTSSDDAFESAIHTGSCDTTPGEVVAELADASLPSGAPIGADDGQNAATSFITVPISVDRLTSTDHAITISTGGETAACGEIGGVLNEAGALVIVIGEQGGSDVSGIAYLGVNANDPSQTDVSLFVAGVPEPAARDIAVQSTAGDSGPTPTPTFEEQVAGHVPLADVRDLAIRTGDYFGDKVIFSGTILSIGVAPAGRVYGLGDLDEQPYSAQMQVTVPAPDGTTEVVYVGYNGDTSGMFEGTWVTVYATVVDYQSGINRLGGQIIQPLVSAEYILIG